MLNAGIIGCGDFGRLAYALNLADHSEVVITGLCDKDEAKTIALAEELVDGYENNQYPSVYTDWTEMIKHESLDVIMVGTIKLTICVNYN